MVSEFEDDIVLRSVGFMLILWFSRWKRMDQ